MCEESSEQTLRKSKNDCCETGQGNLDLNLGNCSYFKTRSLLSSANSFGYISVLLNWSDPDLLGKAWNLRKAFYFLNVTLSLALPELCCKLLSLSDVCIGKPGDTVLCYSKKFSSILNFFFYCFKSFNIRNIFSKGTLEGVSSILCYKICLLYLFT